MEEEEEVGSSLQSTSTVGFRTEFGNSGYKAFMRRLRNKMAAPVRPCGIQSARKSPLPGAKYIEVELRNSNTEWVTLGVDTIDLYVWGYQDRITRRQFRANFLQGTPQEAKDSLFRGRKLERTTSFGGSYTELSRAANIGRDHLELSVNKLQFAITSVYGKDNVEGRIEARFFLIAIQMVAEAARFKYIENLIADSAGVIPPPLMLEYENRWSTISERIHKADAETGCTTLSPPLVFLQSTGHPTTVNQVSQIRNHLGLIKAKK